jgi:hypothetical protein
MTFEEWAGSRPVEFEDRHIYPVDWWAHQAWKAAFRAGQEDMRERAAKEVESFIGWASDHNLECRGDDIRALEIKGE